MTVQILIIFYRINYVWAEPVHRSIKLMIMSTQRTAGNYEEWESHQWMDYDTFEEVS